MRTKTLSKVKIPKDVSAKAELQDSTQSSKVIKTKECALTPQIYYQLWIKKYKRKLIQLFIVFFLVMNLGFYFLFSEDYQRLTWFYVLCSLAVPVLFLIYKILYTKYFYSSKQNRFYYLPCFFEIDEKFIKVFRNDGSLSTYNWYSIIQVEKIGDYYALYVSTSSLIYIPLAVFKNAQDLQNFEEILKERKLISLFFT